YHVPTSYSCDIAARPVQAGDKAKCDRVESYVKYNRNRTRCGLGSERPWGAGRNRNHAHVVANQIGGERWKSLVGPFRPTVVDRYVAALDVTGFTQAVVKCRQTKGVGLTRTSADISDHRRR